MSSATRSQRNPAISACRKSLDRTTFDVNPVWFSQEVKALHHAQFGILVRLLALRRTHDWKLH